MRATSNRVSILPILLTLLLASAGDAAAQTRKAPAKKSRPAPTPTPAPWTFVVAGDSRNCGDVVMPAIAAGAAAVHADFYWHLGDFRAIYDFDQDFLQQPERRGKHVSIADYERLAWDDFIQSQIVPFGSIPVFLAIGNHETTTPKTRLEYLNQFADWLTMPAIRDQRLKDDPKDHRVRSWYHWVHGGIDFVTLDNATNDQFDAEQLRWFEGVVARAEANPEIRAIVLGMHAALPDSLASGHSMNDWPQGEQSGRRVYARLVQVAKKKPVQIFASHSHFYMSGIFDTREKKNAGEALPGWIIGTAGAVRYALPPTASQAKEAKTNVYGYLVGSVGARNTAPGEVRYEFREIRESDVPPATVSRFGAETVHECFVKNSNAGSEPTPATPAASSSPAVRR